MYFFSANILKCINAYKNINNKVNIEIERSAMEKNFEDIREDFINASLDEKIKIYTTTQGLTVEQFKELLSYYPIKHLDKLEQAVNNI